MEEHLRKQVKKSLQELARNMASIIASSTDLDESPPLATIRRNTSVKGKKYYLFFEVLFILYPNIKIRFTVVLLCIKMRLIIYTDIHIIVV